MPLYTGKKTTIKDGEVSVRYDNLAATKKAVAELNQTYGEGFARLVDESTKDAKNPANNRTAIKLVFPNIKPEDTIYILEKIGVKKEAESYDKKHLNRPEDKKDRLWPNLELEIRDKKNIKSITLGKTDPQEFKTAVDGLKNSGVTLASDQAVAAGPKSSGERQLG